MDLFKLEPGLAIWTWVSFGILFFILWKFVLPVMMNSIKDREEFISSAVDNAEKIETRLQEVKTEREDLLKQANKEADEILHQIRQEGESLKKELALKAEEEAALILEQARKAAAAEREAAMEDLRKDLADFICDATEKVMGMAVVGETERAWTKETVEAL